MTRISLLNAETLANFEIKFNALGCNEWYFRQLRS